MYGDHVVKHLQKGRIDVNTGAGWVLLTANGTSNLAQRRHIRLYNRGNPGWTVALGFANVNDDGTFTAPTEGVGNNELLFGGQTKVLPYGENIRVYGQFLAKGGETDGSTKVIVVEER